MLAANVKLLEQALSSPDIKQQAKALATELRDNFLAQGQPMLPPGVSVKLKTDTFLVSSDGDSGQIEATTSDGQTYVLHLVLENGTWLVFYTEAK